MSVTVSYDKKLPIVTIAIDNKVDVVAAIDYAQYQIAEGLKRFNPPYYRIVDLSQVDLDMGEVVEFLQQETSNQAGTATDLRFVPIYVGADSMVKLIADSLSQEQYGGIESYHFSKMDLATRFIKQELMSKRNS